ncbi:hypothetical protein AGABI2DRAFT_141968 [Agaricus bisporus var. bisporus H97]|uniref:hypothetical protein n=1 Tax=Agaricus bisporus var. bisporus (strain H97 / ATCC MYA-4626 / FGSC 10389) TaxID=936046 RepID=UPI00029F5D56|nr:hypothetical protein AGABI2DRAFT_141968 [Agaricus bisporus var. bisporus H97]EKV49356.1 hypothetical protein AGABI2DRAFT_141968 [Agaricus bisporus var. bisporus H97]
MVLRLVLSKDILEPGQDPGTFQTTLYVLVEDSRIVARIWPLRILGERQNEEMVLDTINLNKSLKPLKRSLTWRLPGLLVPRENPVDGAGLLVHEATEADIVVDSIQVSDRKSVVNPLEFIRSFEVEILNAGFVALTVFLVNRVKIRENSPVEALDNVDGDEYEEGIDTCIGTRWNGDQRAVHLYRSLDRLHSAEDVKFLNLGHFTRRFQSSDFMR